MSINLIMTHAADAKEAKLQAGGLVEISLGLNGTAPLGDVEASPHSEGVPESVAWFDASIPLRLFQGRARHQLAGDIARRLPHAPAHFSEPSGLIAVQARSSSRPSRSLRENPFGYE